MTKLLLYKKIQHWRKVRNQAREVISITVASWTSLLPWLSCLRNLSLLPTKEEMEMLSERYKTGIDQKQVQQTYFWPDAQGQWQMIQVVWRQSPFFLSRIVLMEELWRRNQASLVCFLFWIWPTLPHWIGFCPHCQNWYFVLKTYSST